MFSPFLAIIQVATPDLFETLILSPLVGVEGSVSVKFAVNTYNVLAIAVVFVEIIETAVFDFDTVKLLF